MKTKNWMLAVAWLLSLTATAETWMTSEVSCRRFTTQDGLPQMQAETVWQDSRGYIYIGTLSGFVRYDGRVMTPFLKGQRLNILAFREASAENGGDVVAMGFRRQWFIDGDGGTTINMRPLDPEGHWLLNNFNSGDLPSDYILLEDEHEENRRLCRISDEGFVTIARGKALDALTPNQRLYIDTLEGLKIPTGNVCAYHRHNGRLYAFATDGAYVVDGHRLCRVARADWSAATYGLIVRSLPSGGMVVADEHSLYRFDGRNVTTIATGINLIKGLFVDCWSRLWVATYQGVYCYFNLNFTNYRLTDENDIVRAVAATDEQIVMGTLNGKLLVDGELLSRDDNSFYMSSAATVGGTAYLAGGSDVCAVSGNSQRWLHLPPDRYQLVAAGNLPPAPPVREGGVDTYQLGGESVIVGSRQRLLSYDPATGRVDTLCTDFPHPWCAATDDRGRLWMGTTWGLFYVEPTPGPSRAGGESKSATAGGKSPTTSSVGKAQHVDYPQNLIVTAMTRDTAGNVLFASTDSLFVIRGGKVEDLTEQMPELCGHEVRALHVSPRGYLVVAVIDGLFVARLDSGCRISDTHFFDHQNGFTLLEPQQATMAETADGRVYLLGVEWMTSFDPERLLADSQYDAYIVPPLRWWQHWWVWVLGCWVMGVGCWVLALGYERRRQAAKMLELKRQKKQKELQINAIRLKTIPHFHSNVMAAIEYFVMNKSTDEASHYLKLYSDFTNQTLSDIDRPARTVAEETAYVRTYLELEKLRYGDRLNYSITVAANVDEQALLPNMLLHTYCQNAIKHGIGPKPEGGHVNIIITSLHDDTVVTVEDDGIGRRAAKKLGQHSTKQGLRILHEQIQLYNKSNDRRIRERVSNLYDADKKVAGTRFEMTIPKGYRYE